jgi:NDP-sugar pyrophosphorylase family protein
MKALILAAGYGTRLEPLTLAVPKPMVPIVNLPTMQHNIELLRRHGFCDIVANVHYYPEQIENYFSDGFDFNVNLSYSYEKALLGTAGGVKQMARRCDRIKETFLVLSSDALTDINLNKMVEYHKRKQALVTIALAKVEDVKDFGVASLESDNRIVGFQEKPKPEEALSNLANTGIYIFEPEVLDLIPDGFYDFGKQLFPTLIKERAPIFGYKMVEYWSDVGGIDKYVYSNYDAMKGTVQIRVPGRKIAASTWVGEREEIDPSARFEGSVIIGDRCKIGKDVYIKDAVIGGKCFIADGSAITGSVIWSDTYTGVEAQIAGSVIGSFCHIGAKAKINPGSVLANCCVIHSATEIPPDTRLHPNSVA